MKIRQKILTSIALIGFIGLAILAASAGWGEAAHADDHDPHHIFLPSITAKSAQNGIVNSIDEATSGATYYVDCTDGNDADPGTSPAGAWRTLARANQASLAPGDELRFKRNCSWTGPLDATWNGTADQPIVIGAYGQGELPRIQDAYSTNIRVSGTYQILDSLHATLSTPPNPDPNCQNQPVAWKAGFAFQDGASYNVVQNAKATKLAIGIFFNQDSSHNKAMYNEITDNHVVWELTQNRALGAMGILLQGENQVVGHNYFTNNRTICTYNGVAESNSIELYAARDSLIHHNVSHYDRVFSELGSNSTYRAENNTYAFNLHVAGDDHSKTSARFIVTRGWDHPHGPVLNTRVFHNTVYLTDKDSKGVTCGMCGTGILTLKNNILWVEREPVWSDEPFVEESNIYWSNKGEPLVLFEDSFMHANSKIADPLFADADNGQFNLKADSPAIGMGAMESADPGLNYDLAQTIVPEDTPPDAGAYQFRDAPWRQVFDIPGRIEAENYREGGPDAGYHDTTAGNSGGVYREDDVDIETTADGSGEYNVGWIAADEWLAYDVNVATTGVYRGVARVSTPSGKRRFRIELNGDDISGSVIIPWTGGWQNWTDVTFEVPLQAGQHTLRLVAETERFNVNYLHFDRLE